MTREKSVQGQTESHEKPRALVVDDEPDIRLMLDLFLRNAGYAVWTAPTALAALELAGRQQGIFDLIISDIGLPAMDGYQLAERMRRLPGYDSTPMIAITGFVEYADRTRALQSGFNERLTKPINLDALTKVIKRLSSNTR